MAIVLVTNGIAACPAKQKKPNHKIAAGNGDAFVYVGCVGRGSEDAIVRTMPRFFPRTFERPPPNSPPCLHKTGCIIYAVTRLIVTNIWSKRKEWQTHVRFSPVPIVN